MIKKFIALSLAVLVMASHMVSAYAADPDADLPVYSTANKTVNEVIGNIDSRASDPNYKTFWASTSAPGKTQTYGYIYVRILLESAEDNTKFADKYADGHNLHLVERDAAVNYGFTTHTRLTSTHKAGSSENNLKAAFRLRKVYAM